MHRILLTVGLLTSACLGAIAQAQTFTPIGGNGTRPTGLSPDGAWVTGWDRNGSFRWSAGSGFDTFATAFNGEPDIALGGSPVAVTLPNPVGLEEAALWTPTGTTLLGGLGGQSYTRISSARACSDDGSVVVGLGWLDVDRHHAFRWDSASGMVDLGTVGGTRSQANGVSGDGTLVVGWDVGPGSVSRPSIWPGGVPTLLSSGAGAAWAASRDGSVVVGVESREAFRWTAATGLVSLGKLAGSASSDHATALDVSDDGDTIVGRNGFPVFGSPYRAFVWRPGAGMVEVEALVKALGGAIPGHFAALGEAVAVSADGRTIAGRADSLTSTRSEGWTFTLPPVATTYCTGKINSQGCLTAIAFDGTPSASSGAGFDIGASNLVPNASGLLLYGTSGAAATPFQGGFLCVATPIQRTVVQNSGGSGPCSGAFTFDFNAFVPVSGNAALVAGANVWAQYWSRDPASPSTTNLTDALTFTLWP